MDVPAVDNTVEKDVEKSVGPAASTQKGGRGGGTPKAKNEPRGTQQQGWGKRDRNQKKGMVEVSPTYGCRDFYPEEMRLQNWLFDHFRAVAKLYGFQEYTTPIVESQELYTLKNRGAGEELLTQMYSFTTKDDRAVTLRPEMTPSLARLVLKAGRSLLMPIRWFSIPQCWRFETTTRGRNREHYQWNMDILGVDDVSAEVELFAAIVTFFKRVGITSNDVGIKINSRQVLHAFLSKDVDEEKFAAVCIIVDKLDKLEKVEVERQLNALGLGPEIIEKIQKTLTIKDLEQLRIELPGSDIVKQFDRLWELARAYGIDDWLQFDASVVRGLAYYTGIVFEGFDKAGVLRAICGGGRYNKLFTTAYGAKEDIPAVGFGFGDCVIVELLKEKKVLPVLEPTIDDIVILFDESLRPAGCQVAAKLREKGRCVDIILGPKKIPWSYNYADRVSARRAILLAPDEWAKGLVRVKELRMEGAVNVVEAGDRRKLVATPDKEFNIPFAEL